MMTMRVLCTVYAHFSLPFVLRLCNGFFHIFLFISLRRPFAIRVTEIAFIANDDIIISIAFCCDFMMQIFFSFIQLLLCTTFESFLHTFFLRKKLIIRINNWNISKGNISPFFIPDDLFFCIQNQHDFIFILFFTECLSSYFFVLHFTPSVILLGFTCTRTINTSSTNTHT